MVIEQRFISIATTWTARSWTQIANSEHRNTCTSLIIALYVQLYACCKYTFHNFTNLMPTCTQLHLMVTLQQMNDTIRIHHRYLCFQPYLLQLYVRSQSTYIPQSTRNTCYTQLTQLYNFQATTYLFDILTHRFCRWLKVKMAPLPLCLTIQLDVSALNKAPTRLFKKNIYSGKTELYFS